MKSFYLFLFSSCFNFVAPAQNTCPVKRAYAFITVSMPGMIAVDEKGNPREAVPSMERCIYLECSGSRMPLIDQILYDNSAMKSTLSRINGSTIIVGKQRENGFELKLTCRKGYTLWKVELNPVDQQLTIKQDCKNIIIKSRFAGRLCRINLYREAQLMSLPRY